MPLFNTQIDLRNGKKKDIFTSIGTAKINFSENTGLLNAHRSNPYSDYELHISTEEAVD